MHIAKKPKKLIKKFTTFKRTQKEASLTLLLTTLPTKVNFNKYKIENVSGISKYIGKKKGTSFLQTLKGSYLYTAFAKEKLSLHQKCAAQVLLVLHSFHIGILG